MDKRLHDMKEKHQHSDMHQILPGLYLGGKDAAMRLVKTNGGKENVSHILNVADRIFYAPFHPKLKLEMVSINDHGRTELSKLFKRCFQFIDDALQNSGKVLVHCHLGVNRSATIIIAYICRERKCSFKEAFDFAKSKRCVIDPVPQYKQQIEANLDLIHGLKPQG